MFGSRATTKSAALSIAMTTRDDARLTIRIEVVVEMNAVDVVAPHDVENRLEHVLASGRLAGIDPRLRPVFPNPFRMLSRDVRERRLAGEIRQHRAEWVEPRVEL